MQELGERLGLGVEPLRAALGLGERLARGVERLAGRRMRGLGAQRGGFRLGDRGLRRFDRAGERREIGPALSSASSCGELGFDRGDLAVEAREPLAVLAHARLRAGCAAR